MLHSNPLVADSWPTARPAAMMVGINSLAASNSDSPATTGTPTSALNSIMDKIRSRANQYKVWPEIMKLSKAAMTEKRGLINDAGERNQIERCLDTIQKNIKITSLQSMVERLETITRQVGLKFIAGATETDVFITSDMFYVEVILEPAVGYVTDVKIAHAQADPVSCQELAQVLRDGDFSEFTRNLEGLSAIYQLTADKKQKTKAYSALHSLETDLSMLYQYQSYMTTDTNFFVHKTPVGILEPRKGGHPMKLTYFVSPYDLLDIKTKSAVSLTTEVVIEKKLGYSATVCIESATKSYKLQNASLISPAQSKDAKNFPSFQALTNLNSSSLPAYFVLKLSKPLPMSLDIMRRISAVTTIELATHEVVAKSERLVTLIAKQILAERETPTTPNKPYYVKLPDQEHCYYINEGLAQLDGVTMTTVPFCHPTHVPQILVFLRQQVLFNALIGSCVRKLSRFDVNSNQLTFEVTTQSMSNINVSFEHPVDESLATLDIDLQDITSVKCKLYNSSSFTNLCSDDYASKVMQRCLSIPVTMRSIILKCHEKAAALREQQLKQQQVQQLNSNNDMYNLSNSLNSSNGDQQSDISNYLSQQLLANQYRQNSSTGHPNEAGANLANSTTQQFNKMMASNGAAATTNNNGQHGVKSGNTMTIDQQVLQNQEMIRRHLYQQQLHRQQAGQQVVSSINQNNGGGGQPQVLSLAQQKQNQMLMSMLSDTPAANSVQQQQQQVATYNMYQQQLQQQAMDADQLQQQLQQLQQQAIGQQQQAVKGKKTRKRKTTAENGIRSPASSTGRSPKRKMSEDEYSRDLAATPSSDYLDLNFGDGSNFGGHVTGSRPASAASSSTPSYDQHAGTPRSLEQMLAIKAEPGSLGDGGGGDIMANYQFLSRSMSAPGSSSHLDMDFPDLGGFELGDFGPPSVGSALGAGKTMAKRRNNRKSSDGDALGLAGLMGDEGQGSGDMLKSLDDMHGQSTSTSFTAPASKLIKGRPAGDGRRCSSAGIGETGIGKRASPFPSVDDSAIGLKKERKRKRAESVDSLKSVANAGSTALMPPPLISSTGEVTTSAQAGGLMNPAAAYAFMDNGPNGLVPALRPITLNVKPMLPTSSTNVMTSKSPSGGPGGKKVGSAVSSTGGSSGTKLKLDGKVKVARGALDMNGGVVAGSSRPGPKGTKFNKISSSKGLVNSPTRGLGAKAGLKLKSGGQVTSSSSAVVPSRLATSPPVSSSSLSVSPPFAGQVGVSSSKSSSSQSAGQSQATGAAAKPAALAKKKVGLSSIIDKLSKVQGTGPAPGAGQGSSVDGASTSSTSPGGTHAEVASSLNKAESSGLSSTSSSSRPDSSSGQKAGQMGKAADKVKFSRADQFTVKQGGQGLKLTINKTKPSSSTGDTKVGGVKLKAASSSGVKSGPSSSSGGGGKLLKGGPGGLKRQQGGPGMPTYKPNFKGGVGTSSGVSSSSSSALTSPKTSGGSGSVSVSPKLGQPGNRSMGANKVSSSGAAGGGGPGKSGKISSSSGASAILHAALPTLRIDQLPKIPRTAQATSAAASSASGSQGQVSQSSQPAQQAPAPSPTVNTSSILSQPTIRRPVPQPLARERNTDAQAVGTSVQTSDVTTQRTESCSDRFQSNAITSSHVVPALQVAAEQPAQAIMSSSGPEDLSPQQSTSGGSAAVSTAVSNVFPAASSLHPELPSSGSDDFMVVSGVPVGGVSSSSDAGGATSTPSSPAEMASLSDALQNIPLIIPTESFDEPDRGLDGLEVRSSSSSTSSRPQITATIDSTEGHMGSGVVASSSMAGISSTSSASDLNGLVSESMAGEEEVTPSSAVMGSVKDDEEEEDGLVIDFTSAVTPSRSELTPQSGDALQDSVSSSNAAASSEAVSSPTPGPSGPKSPSEDVPPSSSTGTVTGAPSSSSSAIVNSSSSSVVKDSDPVAASSSSSTPPASSTPSAAQSGSNSPVATSGQPSFSSIDDDLMDEALVLSQD